MNLQEAIEQAMPRHIEPEDWLRFRRSIAEILMALGLEVDSPATAGTPERFLQALCDATIGYEGDHKLLTTFPTECRCDADCLVSQIIEGPIAFHALCEHHALPFHGFAHIGYVSHERIIGISKLTRLVRLFARRFTLQERLGEQIADAFAELLEPHGVAVHLEAGALQNGDERLARPLLRQPGAATRVSRRDLPPGPFDVTERKRGE
jgi:GTP cyclohydrolase I